MPGIDSPYPPKWNEKTCWIAVAIILIYLQLKDSDINYGRSILQSCNSRNAGELWQQNRTWGETKLLTGVKFKKIITSWISVSPDFFIHPSVQVTNATSSLLLSQDLGEFTDQGQVKSSHFPLPWQSIVHCWCPLHRFDEAGTRSLEHRNYYIALICFHKRSAYSLT